MLHRPCARDAPPIRSCFPLGRIVLETFKLYTDVSTLFSDDHANQHGSYVRYNFMQSPWGEKSLGIG